MKINQIAVFMENRPGHIRTICRTLAEAGVNINTLSLADTQQYGILRLLTDNWEGARDVLAAAGFVVNVTEVLAVEVDDAPGGLLRVLDIIGANGLNIEYMYAFTHHRGENAIMIFRFDNPDKAISALQGAGVKVVPGNDIFGGGTR